ncbi:MAG: hypothetical protein ACRDCB_10255 [Clostridium sp.]
MKKIYGFNQENLINLGLDNDDALILSVVRQMFHNEKTDYVYMNNKKYIWINQTNLVKNYIPIIKSLRTFQRKLKKIEEKGIIERKVVFEKVYKKNKKKIKGKFSYIHLNEYNILFTKNDVKVMPKEHYKETNKLKEIYNYYNSKNITNKISDINLRSREIEKIISEYDIEEIKKAIDNYCKVIFDKSYYFNQIWDFNSFFIKRNAFNDFIEEGEKWINYKNDKNILKAEDKKSESYKKFIFD